MGIGNGVDHDCAGICGNHGHYAYYVRQRLISFEIGAVMVLGENIGTTITANLAALTGNTQARRAALASNLVFNVFA